LYFLRKANSEAQNKDRLAIGNQRRSRVGIAGWRKIAIKNFSNVWFTQTRNPRRVGVIQINSKLSKAFSARLVLTVALSVTIGLSQTVSAMASTPVPMLTPISVESMVSQGQAPKSALSARAKGMKTGAITIGFNAEALHVLPVGGESVLSLPNGKQYVVVKDSQTAHADGSVSWVGTLRDIGSLYKVIATTGMAGTFASIRTPDDDWTIVPGAGVGFDFLVNATLEAQLDPIPGDTNDFRFPHKSVDEADGSHTSPAINPQNTILRAEAADRMRASFPSPLAKAAPSPQATIDVLVVVTKGFADFHGANMNTRINQAFATTNTAYVSSEVAITIRRVGPVVVKDYADTGVDKSAALTAVTDNTGVFSDVESIRASAGADLVAFLRNANDGGVAWIGQVRNLGAAESWQGSRFMYSVTGMCNFSGCDSVFAHELGHNMGLLHDRANSGAAGSTVRSYAFGWKINVGNAARDFRTIMSYSPPGNRVLAFSNPNRFICNPAGWSPPDACGVANSEDNARALNENRFMLAAITGAAPVVPITKQPNDLDGDGTSDLLVQSTNGTTSAWLMSGNVITRSTVVPGNDPNMTISHTGDFNGDGKADILWRNTNGAVTMWLMNGTAITSAVGILGPDPSWRVSQIGDFNGDGKADILWRNNNGAVTMWLMNGTAITSAVGILGPDPSWRVSHTADFNGDGKSDLIWRNLDGSITAWMMNGITASIKAGLAGAGTLKVVP
jgi:peptidyl-Asp metalloendopeptidase